MTTTSGQFCPACKFKNDLTATVCIYCGTPLENVHKSETTTRRVNEETKILNGQQWESLSEKLVPVKGIAIFTQGGTLVEIREEKEFFLGREIQDTRDKLVDLIPFSAFQHGVSRRHALIRRVKQGYEIVDLDSTNGTSIDGTRLVSNQPYPLPNAARVSLGRMHLVVLYKTTTENKKHG